MHVTALEGSDFVVFKRNVANGKQAALLKSVKPVRRSTEDNIAKC
jgi:hypothetical protein